MQLLLFFLTFSLQVRVKAEHSVEVFAFEQEPAACWRAKGAPPCALRSAPGNERLEFDEASITFDRLTTVMRAKDGELRLLVGQLWVKCENEFRLGSEFGAITVEPGEYWFSRRAGRVVVSVVRGMALLQPRGAGERLQVGAGLENWLGRVGTNGKASHGAPMQIVFKTHLERWARLFHGPRADFEREASDFHETWLEANVASAEVHRALFDRKIASLKELQDAEAVERARVRARDKELVDLFKKKVFEE